VRTISDQLIPRLRERFPNRGLRITNTLQPCAIFPAIHLDVGDVVIHDDGDELTLYIGEHTHGHFSNYDDALTVEQKAEAIVNEMLGFLDALFADQVGVWSVSRRAGGWYHLKKDANGRDQDVFVVGSTMSKQGAKHYVWSGPMRSTA